MRNLSRSLLLLLLAGLTSLAQTIDASHIGEPVTLDTWRFHAGDNSAWSDTAFDDASWLVTSASKSWGEQGLSGLRGYFWYRSHVRLPRNSGPLSLLISQVGPYEIFVNGTSVGSFGSFPPHWQGYRDLPRLYPVPNSGADTIVIAIRFWLWPQVTQVWGFPGKVILGGTSILQRVRELLVRQTVDSQIPGYMISLLWLLLCGGLIILFVIQRDHSEYFWLAIAGIFAVLNGIRGQYQNIVGIPIQLSGYLSVVAGAISAMSILEFIFRFLREPMPRWMRVYQFAFPVTIAWFAVYMANMVTASQFDTVWFLFRSPYWLLVPLLVLWRYMKGNREAGLLGIPLFLIFLNEMLDMVRWVLWLTGLRNSSEPFVGKLTAGFVKVDVETIAHFLFLLSIAALILYRFQKTRTEQARARAELEAARSMQEVLVPTSVSVSGFQVETAYLPAQEVGGDFFQLFPGSDGSLMVVIGDVSGKGLRAAMLVSMILGLLRRTVEQTRSPAQVLRDVNRCLIGHTDGKFATCCCALLYPNGSGRAANAGHLSPYCDGCEIDLPGGLPLGLSTEAEYEEVILPSSPGKRWVFLSDGVVEARSKSGELYGFDRARVVSVRAASEIAQTAQQFGQEDDITVLGIQAEPTFA